MYSKTLRARSEVLDLRIGRNEGVHGGENGGDLLVRHRPREHDVAFEAEIRGLPEEPLTLGPLPRSPTGSRPKGKEAESFEEDGDAVPRRGFRRSRPGSRPGRRVTRGRQAGGVVGEEIGIDAVGKDGHRRIRGEGEDVVREDLGDGEDVIRPREEIALHRPRQGLEREAAMGLRFLDERGVRLEDEGDPPPARPGEAGEAQERGALQDDVECGVGEAFEERLEAEVLGHGANLAA
jgi:hypothetical protein